MKENYLKITKKRKENQQPTTKHQTQSAITLVALVITIIILLILAGVAISMITGGEGLFAKVNNSAVKYEKESLKEKLDLAIRTSVIDKMNFNMDIDDVTDVLVEKGHTAQDRLVKMDEKQIIMQSTPEGYLVEITQKEDGGFDIKVLDKGEIELGAFVVGVEITTEGLVLKEVTEETDTTNEYEYYFSVDNGETWQTNEDKTVSTYTYSSDQIVNASLAKMRRVTKTGKIQISVPIEFEFQYTGTYHPFVVQKAGIYQLEVWGAAGGGGVGKGGYAKGNKNCVEGDVLYVYVGELGKGPSGTTGGVATFNGGGRGGNGYGSYSGGFARGGYSGGGATDIRIIDGVWNDAASLDSRIIVAGGAGGSSDWHRYGGAGGGISGGAGRTLGGSTAAGGTQTSGYAKGQGQAGRSKSGVYADMGAEGNGGRRWWILRRIFSASYWLQFFGWRGWWLWLHWRSN